MNRCDKCHQDVPPTNSVARLEIFLGDVSVVFAPHDRHLFPVDGCVGSPSRAQYLGGPRDTRGYGYHPDLEAKVRQAYTDMLREWPELESRA